MEKIIHVDKGSSYITKRDLVDIINDKVSNSYGMEQIPPDVLKNIWRQQ